MAVLFSASIGLEASTPIIFSNIIPEVTRQLCNIRVQVGRDHFQVGRSHTHDKRGMLDNICCLETSYKFPQIISFTHRTVNAFIDI